MCPSVILCTVKKKVHVSTSLIPGHWKQYMCWMRSGGPLSTQSLLSLSPLYHSPLVFSHRCVVLLPSLLHGGAWTGQQVLSRQTQELENAGLMQLFIFDRKRLPVDY